MENKTPYIDRTGGKMLLKIGDKSYMPNGLSMNLEMPNHVSKIKFIEVKPEDYDKHIDELAEKIVKNVNTKDVIKSVLISLPMSELKKLEKNMKTTRKPKQVRGCYGLKYGKYELCIVP